MQLSAQELLDLLLALALAERLMRYVRVLHCLGCMEGSGEAVLNDELATPGSPLFSRKELDASLQLSLYALAAHRMWPWAKKVRLSM